MVREKWGFGWKVGFKLVRKLGQALVKRAFKCFEIRVAALTCPCIANARPAFDLIESELGTLLFGDLYNFYCAVY